MRYQRQILLPEIGDKGQSHLHESKVLVIGAGGLGHPVIQYLAGMGVGHIGVVDGDSVHESNLHRQIIFDRSDIGKNKALVVQDKYIKRNEPVTITAYPHFLTKSLALELFREYDVVVDGTDNFEAKFLINDVCCYLNKPFVYGAISQFEGQVSVFWRGRGPCYRCLVNEPPKAQIQNCAEAGVVGALPGAIGSIQAIETLKTLMHLKGHGSRFVPLVGKIQFFDFLDNSARTLKLSVRDHCMCQNSNLHCEDIVELKAPVCVGTVKDSETLLDVREVNEWKEFHIPGSVHWPLSRIQQGEFPTHLENRILLAICRSGSRAKQAAQILQDRGFKHIQYTTESIYGYQVRQESSSQT